MTAAEMWAEFTKNAGIAPDTAYEAWAFGDAPDKLAQLVLDGIKTATSSAHAPYAIEGEELPQVGEYSVLLDSTDRAVCVICTTRTAIVPFDKISPEHAYREGEGDRSLAYWRSVHEAFFTDCLRKVALPFTADMAVVCEEFTKLYP